MKVVPMLALDDSKVPMQIEPGSLGATPAHSEMQQAVGSMLVLTDDKQEYWHLEQLARQMHLASQCFDNGVTFVNEVVDACRNPSKGDAFMSGFRRLKPLLVVFAGNLPAWVHLDLYKRMQAGGNPPSDAAPVLQLPPVLFISQTPDLERIANYLHGDLVCVRPQMLGDLLERPARDGEFLVRAKSLLLRHTLVDSTPGKATVPMPKAKVSEGLMYVDVQPAEPQNSTWGAYSFDVQRSRVFLNGQEKKLSYRQFRMALILFSNMGKPVSRSALGSVLFSSYEQQEDDPSHGRVLDAHAYRLRKVLELSAENGYQLESVYRVGYVIRQA